MPSQLSSPGIKSWTLLAPDWSALDTIWRNPMPFVLWPVGNQPLLAHWMDKAVRQNIDAVEIFVPDRPADVRLWLEGGAYWSRQVKVTPIGRESDAPAGAQRLDHLPGDPATAHDPADAGALLRHWFELQNHWLKHRLDELPSVDARHETGGWTGPHALAAPVRAARAGMFSLADLHGCSSVEDADEWIHASYQAQAVDLTLTRRLWKNLWKIAWSHPTPTHAPTR